MQRAELEATLAHVRAAERSLRVALGETGEEYEELPKDLPSAYMKLLWEHRALCAQYEKERKTWLEFKEWWRSRIQARRSMKKNDNLKETNPSTPTQSIKRSPNKNGSDFERTPTKRSSPIPTPRRSRQRILEHRKHVQSLLQDNPSLFKGIGRYAKTAQVTPRLAVSSSPKQARRQMHTSDCACCRDVRALLTLVLLRDGACFPRR